MKANIKVTKYPCEFMHSLKFYSSQHQSRPLKTHLVHRPPKVWHHLGHRRHATVLIPNLGYLLSMIITNRDFFFLLSFIDIHILCIWCESHWHWVAICFAGVLFKSTENNSKFNQRSLIPQSVCDASHYHIGYIIDDPDAMDEVWESITTH